MTTCTREGKDFYTRVALINRERAGENMGTWNSSSVKRDYFHQNLNSICFVFYLQLRSFGCSSWRLLRGPRCLSLQLNLCRNRKGQRDVKEKTRNADRQTYTQSSRITQRYRHTLIYKQWMFLCVQSKAFTSLVNESSGTHRSNINWAVSFAEYICWCYKHKVEDCWWTSSTTSSFHLA